MLVISKYLLYCFSYMYFIVHAVILCTDKYINLFMYISIYMDYISIYMD